MNSQAALKETLKTFSISIDDILEMLIKQNYSQERDLEQVRLYLKEAKLSSGFFIRSTTLNRIENSLPSKAKAYYFFLRMYGTV
ncbi:hypothetical protein BV378_00785 [Nostoc sp. RF31YmG]|nr:hypothetical protein BV378_00785 [Nostoc sp. RF31YmG]